ncbi:dimethyladenosine transferase [Solidesulfovibrio fructosivorans JJ]]|uniref:Ribosomal RNA small subunit methyltransferase A n=1 Tax=Solidesulfovibrio fructosivorans JJ] TaxID=596151 RepID=E1JR35_SOLFR|nr:16S rRNA (adenine(1518)-N(6)/adenine(1519)-N(6))-dimethyltransferase RsmA [Solidesulfovibrio fructosivorans]EFL53036.1 dimethyladenosine transferase [Solidesulfovibrio fructosivorans JJ]]
MSRKSFSPATEAPTADGAGESFARAKRSLGQNFLSDPNTAAKIVSACGIAAGDTVIEIGPGRGALTGLIAAAGPSSFLALEKDRELAAHLSRTHPSLAVALTDALRQDWSRLDRLSGNVRIIGNLPYNIASPLLWDLCAGATRFTRAAFMVQHEVALRLCAGPGGREYGALSAWIASHVRVAYCFKVPPTVFRPRPKVDSAVVAMTPLPLSDRPAEPLALAKLLKTLFSKRRKQLGGILKAWRGPELDDWLAGQGIRLTDRPETLAPKQLAGLAEMLKMRLTS